MEGLAAASSVTGVLSLAGQTIDGIVKLHSFFKDVSSASRTIGRFLQGINQLIKLIEDVKTLLQDVVESPTQPGADFKIAALEIQLEDCSRDVYRWLKLARDHHPGFSTGTKAGFKKFWVAVNKGEVRGISEDIREHRHGIVASLSVLGRAMNAAQSTQMSAIQQTLEEAAQDATKFRRDSMQQLMKIDSVEQCSKASLRFGHDSMISLASIALSIAEIERRLSLVHISSAQSVPSGEAQMQCTPQSTGRIQKSSSNDLGLEGGVPSQLQAERGLGGTLRRRAKEVRSATMFTLGGSSASGGSSGSAWDAASIASNNSKVLSNGPKKWTSFKEDVITITIQENQVFDDDVFQTDEEDEIDEDAFNDDDDDDSSDWDVLVKDTRESNIKEKSLFQRVNSRPNLTSRRSLIQDILGQQEPVVVLGKSTLKSILKGEEPNFSSHYSFQAGEYDQKRAARLQSFAPDLGSKWNDQSTMPSVSTEPLFSVRIGLFRFLGETYQVEDLYRIWAAFSKCSASVEDGRRLENISWRLLNRELFCCEKEDAPRERRSDAVEGEDAIYIEKTILAVSDATQFKTLVTRRHSVDVLRRGALEQNEPASAENNHESPPANDQKIPSQLSGGSVFGQSSESLIDRTAAALLESSKPLYPAKVASYISKSRLLQTIEQQMSLLSLQAASKPEIQQHLDNFTKQLEAIKRCLTRLRIQCLKEGHSLHLINEVLNSCKIHDPVTGLRLPTHNTAASHTDLLALRKRTLKHKIYSTDPSYTKRDRINRWLFQNLQNSPENAALHRSMMTSGTEKDLDEKSWARTVVKYWSIDEAATGEEYEAVNASTNEAADSYARSLDDNEDGKEESWAELGVGAYGMPKVMQRIVLHKLSPTTSISRIEFPVRRFSSGRGKKAGLLF